MRTAVDTASRQLPHPGRTSLPVSIQHSTSTDWHVKGVQSQANRQHCLNSTLQAHACAAAGYQRLPNIPPSYFGPDSLLELIADSDELFDYTKVSDFQTLLNYQARLLNICSSSAVPQPRRERSYCCNMAKV